jgi:hypothetical protein
VTAASAGGVLCVGLIAVAAIKARGAFASKSPQPDSIQGNVSEEFQAPPASVLSSASLTPNMDVL